MQDEKRVLPFQPSYSFKTGHFLLNQEKRYINRYKVFRSL